MDTNGNRLCLLILLLAFTWAVQARESYSPYVGQSYPNKVYWGDTHLHTKISFDSFTHGITKPGPDEAFRFAKGEVMTGANGMQIRLSRPLDFLVIADHAEYMGLGQGLERQDPILLKSALGKRLLPRREEIMLAVNSDPQSAFPIVSKIVYGEVGLYGNDIPAEDDRFRKLVWDESIAIADRHNDPHKFTAFIGFEWTAGVLRQSQYSMYHRVVIFRDGAEKVGKVLPFSLFDSRDPEKLWSYMENYETKTGGEVLAIPHSADGSRGLTFALETADGDPLSTTYAKTRSRWEPLYEVTQMMSDSETHPLLSPTDEFANYETYPYAGDGWRIDAADPASDDTKEYGQWIMKHKSNDPNWVLKYGYARSALKLGLQQKWELGVNPFKFGMIGSTDSHTAFASAEEDNYWGKVGADAEPSPQRIVTGDWWRSASGYAAVWASENTREALFAAMKRKEVYATTGPRITVRFFGGWDYQRDDAFKNDLAAIGYTKGVPMGGDLSNAPKGEAPSFLIRAVKDPDGANLDRVQVIKGWRSQDGKLHEKIYNVALSDGRREDRDGKAPSVGNTVNVKEASYTNTIGEPELAVVWTDPDFDPGELAFYYIRVLEIPTPRWTAYDAKFFELDNTPEEVPMMTQERAYSSPIWFTPNDHQDGDRDR